MTKRQHSQYLYLPDLLSIAVENCHYMVLKYLSQFAIHNYHNINLYIILNLTEPDARK
jgi:hypothetical protein